jgi:signal transduction histidine kinase
VVLARAVADAAIPAVTAHGHRFELLVPAGTIELAVDPARIRQVLHNLLVNAAKYSEAGGVVRLHVLADEVNREVVFRVEDTGRGLSEEELGRVFSPFEQGSDSLESAEGGIGVGLTLARRLVEMHGGSIQAASPGRGRGSTFEVRLPHGTF